MAKDEVEITEIEEENASFTEGEPENVDTYERILKRFEDLEQRVSDLETLVSQPEGAVRFFELEGVLSGVHNVGDDEEHVEEYKPAHQDGGDTPWYG